MAEKSTLEKLALLLPHWLEHNQAHRQEFGRWAEAAMAAGEPSVAALIERAMARLEEADTALEEARVKLGGPPAGGHHHHHRHHD